MKANSLTPESTTAARLARTLLPPFEAIDGRLRVDVLLQEPLRQTLARDVQVGLASQPKALPPKYFYDDRGSTLFDAICDLPEYYLTRIGQALFEAHAAEIVTLTQSREIVELGSGTSRNTRVLLNTIARRETAFRYLPFDVSAGTLRRAALELLRDYPQLSIHAMVGDYERDLEYLPWGEQRLVLFLGSTIGNFSPDATTHFLSRLRGQLVAGEYLLVGVDLVKPVDILEAAYNDSAGITAEFNRNVLRVINRQLGADFVPERFDHLAFFNRERSQIEMHLRARSTHTVAIRTLGMTVAFEAGETIHTEISRKFTRAEVDSTLNDTGFELLRWYTPANNYFALALARAV